jgi:hypothetical protein
MKVTFAYQTVFFPIVLPMPENQPGMVVPDESRAIQRHA